MKYLEIPSTQVEKKVQEPTCYGLDMSPNRLLDETQAAAYLGFTRRALQNWRHRGGGPRYVRASARAIRYRVADLDAWAEERLVANTSQYAQAA